MPCSKRQNMAYSQWKPLWQLQLPEVQSWPKPRDSAIRVLSMVMTINTHSKYYTQLLITALVEHKTVRNSFHQLKGHYKNSTCLQYNTSKQLKEGIDIGKIDSSSMYSRQRTHSFKIARLLQYLPYAQSHIAPYSYLVYRIYILTDTAEEVSHFTINIWSKKCLHKHCDWRLGLKTVP